ncbi:MAG: efflux RND transporter periplasmic adaptor subunit [Acinetobacter populi]|jgi:multidrug efflux system membrane fusion protein|uniref:efflux RND transporter periplasmic adaptor subunit n=1 Tax=Acinetobacter populi TaxID=1582270 RepID=UPI00235728EB|nr:efflux RND transporter periplasmic adaptor subunit [Acinetobacter populi]MCH4248678.1 efflux RND transporter periplasmic adaptor subunit [Acinetobacter populi]
MSEQNIQTNNETQARPRNKWMIFLFIVIFFIFCAGLIWKFVLAPSQNKEKEFSQWSQPVPVRVVPLSRGDLQLELKAVGTAVPTQAVTVQSRVSGVLEALYFKDGDSVQKGQLLAQIDPVPLQVALDQALGNQQQHLAQLQHAQAELLRNQTMLKQDAISRQEVDQQQSLVSQLKGQSKAYQAQVDSARLQLSYCKIYAPISGQVGFRQKDIGNLIQANDETGLVTITQTTPIYVEFALAENYLDLIRDSVQAQQKLQVEAWDRQEQKQLAQGTLFALDNQIDASTGTLKLKAIFPNQNKQLFANQFVNVRIQAQTIANAVTVPSDAIQHGAKGSYVYIVDKDKEDGKDKAYIKMLQLGMSTGGKTQVLSGLSGNEKVVLEGIDRLSEDREVRILNEQAEQAGQNILPVEPASQGQTG